MNFTLNKQNISLLALGVIIMIFGVGISVNLKEKPSGVIIESHSTIPFVHGAEDEGCVKCHTQPIVANCLDCHDGSFEDSPPQTLDDDVDFPHHDPAPGGPPDNCGVAACHDAGSDGRFVSEPNADHNYCDSCHSEDISHG
jgi:hypothetical protein